MKNIRIGTAIAFLALLATALTLEVLDKPAAGLWVMVVLMLLFADFDDDEGACRECGRPHDSTHDNKPATQEKLQ